MGDPGLIQVNAAASGPEQQLFMIFIWSIWPISIRMLTPQV